MYSGCFRSDFVHITSNLGLILISRHINKCIQNAFSSLVVEDHFYLSRLQITTEIGLEHPLFICLPNKYLTFFREISTSFCFKLWEVVKKSCEVQ